jgi:hypothetical protein
MDVWNIRKQIGLENWCIISQGLVTADTITANVGTEGTVKIFVFWDVFKELLIAQPVLCRFG